MLCHSLSLKKRNFCILFAMKNPPKMQFKLHEKCTSERKREKRRKQHINLYVMLSFELSLSRCFVWYFRFFHLLKSLIAWNSNIFFLHLLMSLLSQLVCIQPSGWNMRFLDEKLQQQCTELLGSSSHLGLDSRIKVQYLFEISLCTI